MQSRVARCDQVGAGVESGVSRWVRCDQVEAGMARGVRCVQVYPGRVRCCQVLSAGPSTRDVNQHLLGPQRVLTKISHHWRK